MAALLFPLLQELDERLDKRWVRTCLACVAVILRLRDRINGLLLWELGGYRLSPEQAPAGKKRRENLLNSTKWQAQLIKDCFLQQADARLDAWQAQGHDALAIWDHRPWEKPASEQSEGLCALPSSQGKRLTPIKPGFFTPPHGPIMVPGWHWLTVLLVGRSQSQDPLPLGFIDWWSRRGAHATTLRDQEARALVALGALLGLVVRCVLGWRPKYRLVEAAGNERLAGKIVQGKRGWSARWVWDRGLARWAKASVLAVQVSHPDHRQEPLYLVVCRGQGPAPWSLLTNEPISTAEDAWSVVLA